MKLEKCSEVGCPEKTPNQCNNCKDYFCQNHMDVHNDLCYECLKEDY